MGDNMNKDIARQFDLPERQSKIATLLKNPDVYCICRSTDATRFMIACDNCEEWYHGDCIGITDHDAKYIKKYFCVRCNEENPDLTTIYKTRKPALHSFNKDRKQKERESEKEKPKERDRDRDKKEQAEKRGRAGRPKKTESKSKNTPRHRRERKEENLIESPDSPELEVVKVSKRKTRRIRIQPSSTSEEEEDTVDYEVRQCYGPGCTEQARVGSKYCCENCGIKLASQRIYSLLPSRITEWNQTPSVAEKRNKEDLEEIRRKMQICRTEIEKLEGKRKKLDEHINYVQQLEIDPDDEETEPEEEEGVMSCITCGHEVSMKTCFKHMEKCYNKHESQTSFASVAKTNVEGIPIFCDYYNPVNNTYCKRLKVLCPEHVREPKTKDNEVCGCPIIRNVFEVTDKICRVPKKKCNRHFCWEKLQRAEIDMERVRQWLKYDELLEGERTLRQALKNRAGLVGILLHSSFDHERNSQQQQQYSSSIFANGKRHSGDGRR